MQTGRESVGRTVGRTGSLRGSPRESQEGHDSGAGQCTSGGLPGLRGEHRMTVPDELRKRRACPGAMG